MPHVPHVFLFCADCENCIQFPLFWKRSGETHSKTFSPAINGANPGIGIPASAASPNAVPALRRRFPALSTGALGRELWLASGGAQQGMRPGDEMRKGSREDGTEPCSGEVISTRPLAANGCER